MGLLGAVFGAIISGASRGFRHASHGARVGTSISFLDAYTGGGTGGYGLERFQAIIEAHSGAEDIVDEFSLDEEDCEYPSLDGYPNPYYQAYEEEYEKAEEEAEMYAAMGIDVDPEELINWEAVEQHAFEYACDLANAWIEGDEWIPEEVMDWAFYDVSDHNG